MSNYLSYNELYIRTKALGISQVMRQCYQNYNKARGKAAMKYNAELAKEIAAPPS